MTKPTSCCVWLKTVIIYKWVSCSVQESGLDFKRNFCKCFLEERVEDYTKYFLYVKKDEFKNHWHGTYRWFERRLPLSFFYICLYAVYILLPSFSVHMISLGFLFYTSFQFLNNTFLISSMFIFCSKRFVKHLTSSTICHEIKNYSESL